MGDQDRQARSRPQRGSAWGIVLVILGVVLLADEILGVNVKSVTWPVGLIALGVWLLATRGGRHDKGRVPD